MTKSNKEILLQGSTSSTAPSSSEVKIRSYESSDYEDCREIFTQGMEQLISLVTRVVFPRYCWILAALSVFAFLAAFKYNLWIVPLYMFVCAFLLSLLYVNVYLECWKFINICLATDLMNIEKSYMSNDGSHMWVAEWNGKVVGMVGLLHDESHEPEVVELYRMYVLSSYRRKGIATKLLERLVCYAREHRYHKIILSTTNAQKDAFDFYQKSGCQLIKVVPFRQKMPTDLAVRYFKLEL